MTARRHGRKECVVGMMSDLIVFNVHPRPIYLPMRASLLRNGKTTVRDAPNTVVYFHYTFKRMHTDVYRFHMCHRRLDINRLGMIRTNVNLFWFLLNLKNTINTQRFDCISNGLQWHISRVHVEVQDRDLYSYPGPWGKQSSAS